MNKTNEERDHTRVESQPLAGHGDLPRQATGPSERRLPDKALTFGEAIALYGFNEAVRLLR